MKFPLSEKQQKKLFFPYHTQQNKPNSKEKTCTFHSVSNCRFARYLVGSWFKCSACCCSGHHFCFSTFSDGRFPVFPVETPKTELKLRKRRRSFHMTWIFSFALVWWLEEETLQFLKAPIENLGCKHAKSFFNCICCAFFSGSWVSFIIFWVCQ